MLIMAASAGKSVWIEFVRGISNDCGNANRSDDEPAAGANKVTVGVSIAVGVRRFFIERLERIAVGALDLYHFLRIAKRSAFSRPTPPPPPPKTAQSGPTAVFKGRGAYLNQAAFRLTRIHRQILIYIVCRIPSCSGHLIHAEAQYAFVAQGDDAFFRNAQQLRRAV